MLDHVAWETRAEETLRGGQSMLEKGACRGQSAMTHTLDKEVRVGLNTHVLSIRAGPGSVSKVGNVGMHKTGSLT